MSCKICFCLFAALLMLVLVFTMLPAKPVYAASYVVNTLNDNATDDGNCTLREAILAANNAAADANCGSGSSADDTITFNVSGVIRLSSVLPNVVSGQGKLTIDGGGLITISGDTNGDNTADVQVMIVNAGGNLTLQNLIVAKGTSLSGGGIFSSGTLAIITSTFSGNSATGGAPDGGGINSSGTLIISNSTFSNNSAGNGGGIFSSGTLSVTNGTFSGNIAVSGGGGIRNNGTLTITNGSFSGNNAGAGGGISNGGGGTLTVSNSTFTGNTVTGLIADGGGISNGGVLTVTNSTFSGNSSLNGGGGINNSFGTLRITNSTLSGNSGGIGGGIFVAAGVTGTIATTTFFSNTTPGNGGGIHSNGTLTITSSTFTINSAVDGGGISIGNGSALTLTNSTFSSNTATTAGGIESSGTINATNSTFSGNDGGGIYRVSGTINLKNTIVTNSTNGGNCIGTIVNGGNNIDSGVTCGWGSASGSMSTTNPQLGALTGTPSFFPLNVGSPAIDAGNNTVCAATPVNNQSQNGMTRPVDGDRNGTATCDIGSYEAPLAIFLPLIVR